MKTWLIVNGKPVTPEEEEEILKPHFPVTWNGKRIDLMQEANNDNKA